jgi:hypothetical protein
MPTPEASNDPPEPADIIARRMGTGEELCRANTLAEITEKLMREFGLRIVDVTIESGDDDCDRTH